MSWIIRFKALLEAEPEHVHKQWFIGEHHGMIGYLLWKRIGDDDSKMELRYCEFDEDDNCVFDMSKYVFSDIGNAFVYDFRNTVKSIR